MAESELQKALQQNFPKSNKEDWAKTAFSELNGNEPFNYLSWQDTDELTFFPYYEKSDVTSLEYLKKFQLAPQPDFFSGNNTWYNVPHISVTDELTANKAALDHLTNGADGVFFNLQNFSSPELGILLKDIQSQYCVLSFAGFQDVNALQDYLRASDAKLFDCNIFWDTIPQTRNIKPITSYPNLKALGLIISPSTPVKELHDALVTGVKTIESLKKDFSVETIIRNVAFSVNVNANFLSEIAKLKALRILWFQIAQAYGISDYTPGDLYIHASSHAANEKFNPHGNMLKATSAAMASVIGGCNALTVHPENEVNSTMNRIARNVSNVLREESHLDKVADPLAGSYAITVMTDQMASRAWSQFQSTMKSND